ncbi:hypothetical protein PAECIP111802_06201 [Paenibacillus allorhizosphaerae]|uniref:Uncharacterized protein n=1 Tax=Paenibacillus allorhizosphaerae TaxID=2849866 RepID=A0ABM8VRV3_9BACL|nr:hypothetical protein PAECIP111802_06201 [Paenibacillus allorhizosphaerae]
MPFMLRLYVFQGALAFTQRPFFLKHNGREDGCIGYFW